MNHSMCPRCGAPLSAAIGVVRCAYCGNESFVGPRPHPSPPPPPSPGYTPERRSSPIAALLLVGMIVVLAGVAGIVALFTSVPSRSPTPPPVVRDPPPASVPAMPAPVDDVPQVPDPPPPPPRPYLSTRRFCLIGDRNGDGANELTALVGLGTDRSHRPAILDGADGSVLWMGESAGSGSDIYLLCAGERWIAILDDNTFELRLLPIEAPEREVRHILSDETFYWGATDDCLRFRLDDNQRPSFSLRDGARQSCDAPLDRRTHIPYTTVMGIISTLGRGASAAHGDMRYRLTTRRPGTAFLQASASRRGRELWNIPLRFVPVGGEAIGTLALVATPDVVVVFGATRAGGRAEGVTALGLNAADGTERFATELRADDVNEVFYNGRYVVVATNRIVAIDPADGQIAWQM